VYAMEYTFPIMKNAEAMYALVNTALSCCYDTLGLTSFTVAFCKEGFLNEILTVITRKYRNETWASHLSIKSIVR
jgi:hypothetical protein